MEHRHAAAFLIAGIALAGLTAFEIVTSLLGPPILMVVQGDSMLPVFQYFDLLVMDPIRPDEVEAGMIVAVDHREAGYPYGGFIVHRVYQFEDKKDGEPWVSTKGDNNEHPDEPVPVSDVVAKVAYSIPLVGFVLAPPVNVMIILALLFLAFRSYKKRAVPA